MEIRVLGPIEIRHGGRKTRLTAPKECALLAALLAGSGTSVPAARLIDALWPGDPPPSAAHNVRLYVARLRRRLGDGDRIVHAGQGYALMAGPEEIDALRFEELLGTARRASGTPADAARLYQEALALWRGSAFEGAGLSSGPARDYAVRLDELRAAAVEEWADVELDLGHHRSLISELRGLTAAAPLRERLHAQLMLALYRSGRQAEALDAYQTARRTLAVELGLEPGPELRALQSAILSADPALDHAGATHLAPASDQVEAIRPAPAVDHPETIRPAPALDHLQATRPTLVRLTRASRPWAIAAGLVLALTVIAGYLTLPRLEEPAPRTTPAVAEGGGDGVLTVGTLLPRTGLLYFIGSSTSNGAKLAVADVNAAGGVLGRPVRLLDADSGDTEPDIATRGVAQFIDQNVDLIVGPASNKLSLSILDPAADAGIAIISPSTTAGYLSTAYDQGMYFRTSAADTLQGRLLGLLAAEDGNRTATIVTLDDDYGAEVADAAERSLAAQGVRLLDRLVFEPGTDGFARHVATIAETRPDALVMIGYEETVALVRELHEQGFTARNQSWYLVDANLIHYAGEVPEGVMAGAKGTLAGAEATGAFAARMRAADPGHDDLSYAAESYDAVVLGALAAEAARSDLGQSIAARLADVSSGGRRCTSYRECAELARAGVDLDYDGVSGRIEFDSNGDVREGAFGVYAYDESDDYELVTTRLVRGS
uniref:Branched-chain amino acid ABC transporter, amino acid-binding protein (TC 3.A.1.4.1) n=1 Tax=Nonomuraea gerenzanensis TaxID=93944 RepID=A0A1M4EFC3_9ACTN|nr:Branched-chain amino acid ABC transporter, amino acid-binding protein (TC 3.A.1.4.1) [Nonomuraea gerenzanensis]